MRKVVVAICILTIAVYVFPLSSWAKHKEDADPLICAFRGDITGLVFDFGDGFNLDFGAFEATITAVEVQASGQEIAVVIPPKRFKYNASLSGGWEGSASDNGKIFANATLDYGSGNIVEDVILEFEFASASLLEQFKIKKKDIPDACAGIDGIPVPKKVELFFEVTEAVLIENGMPASYPLNLVLVIEKGKPVLVDMFDF